MRRQLSGMKLTGELPLDGQLWSRLPSLQELDLANNDLSGFVPPQLVHPGTPLACCFACLSPHPLFCPHPLRLRVLSKYSYLLDVSGYDPCQEAALWD